MPEKSLKPLGVREERKKKKSCLFGLYREKMGIIANDAQTDASFQMTVKKLLVCCKATCLLVGQTDLSKQFRPRTEINLS